MPFQRSLACDTHVHHTTDWASLVAMEHKQELAVYQWILHSALCGHMSTCVCFM